ncbi:hypothetical protein VTL71DRAFT_9895 [Oculimacula yallundae]|uniref:Uncharacterized protein n=1 Tax=Oculimacula yallundae TaxID=86028 RepID=A0ABR4BQT3_9HELO
MLSSLVTVALLVAVTVASPLKIDTKQLTESPSVLLARDPNFIPSLDNIPGIPKGPKNPPVCKTKTIFGPYTLKTPILGFGQAEEYYAEIIDEVLMITGHGPADEPLGSGRTEGPELDYIVTKCITLSWTTSTWYHTIPGEHHPTSCATTKTIHHGLPGFPTDLPILPKPIPHLGWPGIPVPTNKA